MHALLAELGIELFHAYREGDHLYIDADGGLHRYHGDDEPLPDASARAYEAAVAKLDALVAELDPEAPWEHPRAAELDAITLRAVARRRGRRHARARPAARLHGRRLHDEAGGHVLAC